MWRQIEADFMRDYGIMLAQSLERMSWRTFKTLLMGINPGGAFARDYAAVLRREGIAQSEAGGRPSGGENEFLAWLRAAR